MSMRELIHDFATWLQSKSYEPPKIKYYSHVEGMQKWAAPQPTSKYIPDWYKNLPKRYELSYTDPELRRTAPGGIHHDFNTNNHTIKSCPGMQDILTAGYTVPFWANAIITTTLDGSGVLTHTSTNGARALVENEMESNADYCIIKSTDPNSPEVYQYLRGIGFKDDEIGDWRKFQSRPEVEPNFKTHTKDQYSTMVDELPDEWCKVLLKLETPWRISTPPGYSILYTDPTYHFNDCIQVMPGILNTDYWHESNMFLFVKQKGCQFSMNFGQPLVTHIPIKREKLPLEVKMWNEEERQRELERSYFMNSQWQGSKAYRKALKVFGYQQEKKGGCPFHKK
jgi:hypothetical protein